VHGRDALLKELHDHIACHHDFFHSGCSALIVHLGDYIDRGAGNLGVLDRLRSGSAPFPSKYLLGNHEDMLLQCTATDDADVWGNWTASGGATTLAELGIDPLSRDPEALRKALGSDRLDWLRHLPLTYETSSHLFVHAGLRPGIPVAAQTRHDMLWIRTPFLNSDADHGRIVVHGHTPAPQPIIRPNRIGLDVSAYHQLAAAVICTQDRPRLLFAR